MAKWLKHWTADLEIPGAGHVKELNCAHVRFGDINICRAVNHQVTCTHVGVFHLENYEHSDLQIRASIINTREEGVKPLVSAYDSGQVISELIIYQLKTL